MTSGCTVASRSGTFLRGGLAVFVLGLLIGLGLLLRYFYTTPLSICTVSLADMSVTEVWPWALPLLMIEAAALAHAAFGLLLLARVRRQGPNVADGGKAT
jgi:hypothetical protein